MSQIENLLTRYYFSLDINVNSEFYIKKANDNIQAAINTLESDIELMVTLEIISDQLSLIGNKKKLIAYLLYYFLWLHFHNRHLPLIGLEITTNGMFDVIITWHKSKFLENGEVYRYKTSIPFFLRDNQIRTFLIQLR